MEKTLTGKVALVTGGSRGIGAATAIALAAQGAEVTISYVAAEEKARAVVAEIKAQGGRATAFRADQGDTKQAAALVDSVIKEFGYLDILVNNAGISAGGAIDDPKTDFETNDRFWAVNLTGMVATTRAAAKVMRDHGRIISISAPLATRAGFPGGADNAGAKGGMDAYSRGVARDLGPRNITVNSVHLGLVETDISVNYAAYKDVVLQTCVFQRYGRMEEVTHAVLFLASPLASYTTGSVLKVDGGYSA